MGLFVSKKMLVCEMDKFTHLCQKLSGSYLLKTEKYVKLLGVMIERLMKAHDTKVFIFNFLVWMPVMSGASKLVT